MDIRGLASRHRDALLAGVLTAVFVAEVALWDEADHVRAVPCALLAGSALAFRRKTPLAAFLLAWAGCWGVLHLAPGIDNDSVAFIVIFFVSIYSLGRYTMGHEVWLGGLAVLGYVVVFVVGDVGRNPDLGDVAYATLFVGGPWAGGLTMRLRHDRENVLAARNEQLQHDHEEQARRAVTAERSRIARELHDVVSHAIAVTVLQARGGRKMIGLDDPAVRRALDAIEHTNSQALGDMRRLLSLLRDTEEEPVDTGGEMRADPQPSLDRLDSLLARLRDSGLPIELTVTGKPDGVPPGVDLSAYRIIQEALTNVLKHAGPAARARVEITYSPDDLQVCVSDDGIVHSENGTAGGNGEGRGRGHGHGLIGIRERVAVVGGHVEVGPGESDGFVVRARLPYAVET